MPSESPLIWITCQNESEWNAYAQIYREAFPISERKPLSRLQQESEEGLVEHICFYSQGALIGIASLWTLELEDSAPSPDPLQLGRRISLDPNPTFQFIEYLAIASDHRNQGWGEQILRILQRRCKRLLLEIEPPCTSMANRRYQFYRRLGFTCLKSDYQLPPLQCKGSPLEFWLLAWQNSIALPKLESQGVKIETLLHRLVYRWNPSQESNGFVEPAPFVQQQGEALAEAEQ